MSSYFFIVFLSDRVLDGFQPMVETMGIKEKYKL